MHVDLDLYKFTETEQTEIQKQIEEFVLKPSAVIHSGGGKYLFWFLKEPAQKEEIPVVESFNKRLASNFHGDMAAMDASRILRAPGRVNHKYESKPIVTIEFLDPGLEYNLSNFEILPEIKESLSEEGQQRQATPTGKVDRLIVRSLILAHSVRSFYYASSPRIYSGTFSTVSLKRLYGRRLSQNHGYKEEVLKKKGANNE